MVLGSFLADKGGNTFLNVKFLLCKSYAAHFLKQNTPRPVYPAVCQTQKKETEYSRDTVSHSRPGGDLAFTVNIVISTTNASKEAGLC